MKPQLNYELSITLSYSGFKTRSFTQIVEKSVFTLQFHCLSYTSLKSVTQFNFCAQVNVTELLGLFTLPNGDF